MAQKTLKNIREGSRVRYGGSVLEYYIRGKAKNGRVHLACFKNDHERHSWLDVYPVKEEKVEVIVELL
jgi:hypothetical protein